MNNEDRQQNLSRLFMTCNDREELNQFATDFNNQYKVMVDHMERMEELQRGLHKD